MMSEIEDMVMVKPLTNSSKSPTTRNDLHPTEQEEFKYMTELALDAPDCNRAKVEHLKKEIAAGRYQINSHDIAMRMLLNF